MKIIGGKVKGRRLFSPGKAQGDFLVRPTSARAREAIFNIIQSKIGGAKVLDLFAGTGAFGLEALSRGAQSVVFVDKNVKAVNLINKNRELCGFSDISLIVRRDATKGLFFLKKIAPPEGFDLVFIDPPYKKRVARSIIAGLDEGGFISPAGLVIVECSSSDQLPESVGNLRLFDQRKYGEAGFWLYFLQGDL